MGTGEWCGGWVRGEGVGFWCECAHKLDLKCVTTVYYKFMVGQTSQ